MYEKAVQGEQDPGPNADWKSFQSFLSANSGPVVFSLVNSSNSYSMVSMALSILSSNIKKVKLSDKKP